MEFATGTVTLFDFAISCLERIQLARDFKHDFAKHQIQLDIIQVRLSRWGEVAGITKGSGGDQRPGQATGPLDEKACKLLREIEDLFFAAQEKADEIQANEKKKPASQNATTDEPLDPDTNIPPRLKTLRTDLRQWVNRRMSGVARTSTRIQWAFYKKTSFEKFVTDLTEIITALEQLIPEGNREQLENLSKEECEDISKANLETLQEYVDNCDPWFVHAIKEKLENGRSAGITIRQSYNVGQTTGIHNGDVNGVSNGNGNTTTNYWGRKR